VRSLLSNAGGWTPSERLLRRIGGIELRCLRAMGGRTKTPEESDHDFFARLDSIVCGIRDRLHIRPASVQLCGLYLGWAGHVARLPFAAPDVYRALLAKPWSCPHITALGLCSRRV
jgi:hypothetical protein